VLRVVPDVERGEAVNAGVVVYCRARGFLAARTSVPEAALAALAPELGLAEVRRHLAVLAGVAGGDPDAGAVARLEPSERFGWLAAPSSTIIQPSPVHTGLCDDPRAELDRLFDRLVRPSAGAEALASMRETYKRAALDEESLAPDWLTQTQQWVADAVGAAVPEPNAMILATADAAGRPTARTVLLKGLDERGFVFFTNRTSRKARQALANPRAALVLLWLPLERQVLVTGSVTTVSEEESDAYWVTRPRGSRLGAAASPQSQVVASREELDGAVSELAARYPEGSEVPRPWYWGGLRVVPDSVEFWQGRRDRLHDRLRYRRDGAVWVVERLAP
jgi:pyridoxamine 5'-phosphate oxidase